MSLAAPPKILVEHYMIEIARTYKVLFEPDPLVMMVSTVIVKSFDNFEFIGMCLKCFINFHYKDYGKAGNMCQSINIKAIVSYCGSAI